VNTSVKKIFFYYGVIKKTSEFSLTHICTKLKDNWKQNRWAVQSLWRQFSGWESIYGGKDCRVFDDTCVL